MSQNQDYNFDYSHITDSVIRKFRQNNKLKQLFQKDNNDNIRGTYNDLRSKLEKKYLLKKDGMGFSPSSSKNKTNEVDFESCLESLEETLLNSRKVLSSMRSSRVENIVLNPENLENQRLLDSPKVNQEELDDKIEEIDFYPKKIDEHDKIDTDFLDEILNNNAEEKDDAIINLFVSSGEEEEAAISESHQDDLHFEAESQIDNDEDGNVDILLPDLLNQSSTENLVFSINKDDLNKETGHDINEYVVNQFLESSQNLSNNDEEPINDLQSAEGDKIAKDTKEITMIQEGLNNIGNGNAELKGEAKEEVQETNDNIKVCELENESNNTEATKSKNKEEPSAIATAVKLDQKYKLNYENEEVEQYNFSSVNEPQSEAKSLLAPSMFLVNPFEQNNKQTTDNDAESKINSILTKIKNKKEEKAMLQKQKEAEKKLAELQLLEEEERVKNELQEKLSNEMAELEAKEKQAELERIEKKKLETILDEKTIAQIKYEEQFAEIKSEILNKQQSNSLIDSKIQENQKLLDELNKKLQQQVDYNKKIEEERILLEQKSVELKQKIEQEKNLETSIIIDKLKEQLEQQKIYTDNLREKLASQLVEIKVVKDDSDDVTLLKQQLSEEIENEYKLENALSNNELLSQHLSNNYESEGNKPQSEDSSLLGIDAEGIPLLKDDDVYENKYEDEIAGFYSNEGIPEGQYLSTKLKDYLSSKGTVPENQSLSKIQESRAVFQAVVSQVKDSVKQRFHNVIGGFKRPLETGNQSEETTGLQASQKDGLQNKDLEIIKRTYTKRHKLNNSSYRITKVYANDIDKSDLESHPALTDEKLSLEDSNDIKITTLVREKMVVNPTDEVIVISSSDEEPDQKEE